MSSSSKTLPACGYGSPRRGSRCSLWCPSWCPAGGDPEERWWLGVGKLPLWEGSEGSDNGGGGSWAGTGGGLVAKARAVETA